ncbi:MAG: c-type cytochrome [Anaerolineae bacterium]|nr:c-type cytochrome [Anaerolineae bacterium]
MKRHTLLVLMLLALMSAACTYNLAQFLPRSAAVSHVEPVGDAARGDAIFHQGVNGSPPCSSCHLTAAGAYGFSLGPNLAGIGERAATRVAGLDADAYIRQSVLDPRAYLVPGFRDIMYPDFAAHFDDQDITDLIAYLLSL